MKRLREYLVSRDFVLLTLVIMGVRAMVVEPGIGFAITAVAFASLVAYDRYLKHNAKPDVSEELKKELDDLRGNISGLMMKNASKPAQMAQDMGYKRMF